MTRYAALLRGINVGGIRIRMADLKDVFTGLGLTEVRTVLASGNVLFESPDSPETLEPRIEAALTERFGYDAHVFVVERSYLERVVDAFPFDETREGWHSYVVLVSDPAVLAQLDTLADGLDPQLEQVATGEGVLYWQVEKGRTLDSVVGKRSGSAKHKATTTVRNMKTLRKLL
ncbi:DUF1697 domain-containing protein [Rhodococcus sp. Z13]|uniref:DUF1697 domain-containing protein n=1 Tax=Rhodococcus sacchari TaxID=2962047 RepID=A0ACD4DBU2_9NOCA|nr:DUF1697 domain-containing protein [Rhodococcus sp. Z13]UYP17528.1 DUF1697 domain-containing protein [Rhodococcus sp. Z13]